MKIDLAAVNRMTIRYQLENWNNLPEEQQEYILNVLNAHACSPEYDLPCGLTYCPFNAQSSSDCYTHCGLVTDETSLAPNPNCVRGLPKDLCTGCEQCAILDAIE